MNAINRYGQKVICIADEFEWCSQCNEYPRKDKIFTVSGFATDYRNCPCIYLLELPGYDCSCFNVTNQPWDIRGFRPVSTKETDISILKKLLIDSKQKEPENV